MVKNESHLPATSILALIVTLLLILSVTFPFVGEEWTMIGLGRFAYWVSGLTVASGFPDLGIAGSSTVYLIPIGGVIGSLAAALPIMTRRKPRTRVSGLLVIVGGFLGLAGAIITSIQLGPVFELELMNYRPAWGIGLIGALFLATVEIIAGTIMMLRNQI
jgi:hypothetical protein